MSYEITPKGQAAIREIESRFLAGETIEDIAASYDMSVDSLRVLMTLDTLLKEKEGK